MNYVIAVLIDALVTCLLAGGAYFYGVRVGEDKTVAQGAREDHIAQVAIESAQKAAAEAISKIEVKHVTVQGKVQEIVRENTVFRDCKSGPDLVRNYNDTIPGSGTKPPADLKLPAPDPTQ